MMRRVVLALLAASFLAPFLYFESAAVVETAIFYEPGYYTPLANDSDPSDTYPMHQLGPHDRTTLINITDFGYSMRPSASSGCDPQPQRRPLLLALIHSAPRNYDKRTFLRNSWLLHRNQDFVGLFMVGEVDDAATQDQLLRENQLHGDLVQGHFMDSYRNMTYKHVMSLKYAAYECPGARYVLKIDDDVAVNFPFLYKLLQSMSPLGVRDLLLCSQKSWSTVPRSYRSKWRMTFRDYPSYSYPSYCSGGAVVYSPDVVFRLYAILQQLPYFWVDDVHVTGTARVAANLKQMHFLPNTNPFSLMHKA